MSDKRCPYAVQMWVKSERPWRRLLVRCQRRRTLWTHQHRALLDGAHPVSAPAALRWWSSTTPDYHVEYERASAEVVE